VIQPDVRVKDGAGPGGRGKWEWTASVT
jgi:hypothetical protein